MKHIDRSQIPDFAGVVDFAEWYVNAGMPTLFPAQHEVFVTDDATACCLFRHGRFQFEMYMIHPNPVVPKHEHPGVANVEISGAEWKFLGTELLAARVQQNGVMHGDGFKDRAAHHGFVLMSAQMWDEGIEMSTIGARWKGHTAGPKHEALIRRFNPGCLVYPGYADVTQKTKQVEIL
jgi:hypothetical protein